jgi:phospholipase/carboxylesterase
VSELLDCVEQQTADAPDAAVIWLHGLGADGWDFVPIVEELCALRIPATRFIFPNAPMMPVTINGGYVMRAWYDILGTDPVRREDEAGIRASRARVEALIAREVERGMPRSRIVLAGFSQGCAIALHTGLRQTDPLAGLVALSGYLPLAGVFPAERAEQSATVPIFMAHGRFDPVVQAERGRASREQLRALGYAVQWHEYPMEHAVCAEEVQDIARFLIDVLAR